MKNKNFMGSPFFLAMYHCQSSGPLQIINAPKLNNYKRGFFAVREEYIEKEWIFTGDGDVVRTDELHEIARAYDAKTPLEDDELLAVTEDGSIGLMFPHLKEPQWYFVSPEFAVVNILHEDIHKYIVPLHKMRRGVKTEQPFLRELRGKEYAAFLRELRRDAARGSEVLRKLRCEAVKR